MRNKIHITIAYGGQVIPNKIQLGNQHETLDSLICFHFADERLKNYHKYAFVTNGEYSEVLPIYNDELSVSSVLTSRSGKWVLQIAAYENEIEEASEFTQNNHLLLSDEFIGYIYPSKFNVDAKNKPMDENIRIWYEDFNTEVKGLRTELNTLSTDMDLNKDSYLFEMAELRLDLEEALVVKKDFAYEVLMKNATFEHSYTTTGIAYGYINGYSLFNTNGDLPLNEDYLLILNNGKSEKVIDMVSIYRWASYHIEGKEDEKYRITSTATTEMNATLDASYFDERTHDVRVTILHKIQEDKILVKDNRTPLTKPLILDAKMNYEHLPFVGDEVLQAIIDGRQILVKVPNADSRKNVTNFMPIFQYQLPNVDNDHLYLFYFNDGIGNNILAAMQTGNFNNVYGQLALPLSKTYQQCPLK